jgi:hypothetical protein
MVLVVAAITEMPGSSRCRPHRSDQRAAGRIPLPLSPGSSADRRSFPHANRPAGDDDLTRGPRSGILFWPASIWTIICAWLPWQLSSTNRPIAELLGDSTGRGSGCGTVVTSRRNTGFSSPAGPGILVTVPSVRGVAAFSRRWAAARSLSLLARKCLAAVSAAFALPLTR